LLVTPAPTHQLVVQKMSFSAVHGVIANPMIAAAVFVCRDPKRESAMDLDAHHHGNHRAMILSLESARLARQPSDAQSFFSHQNLQRAGTTQKQKQRAGSCEAILSEATAIRPSPSREQKALGDGIVSRRVTGKGPRLPRAE
jgi:hypothetical protein